MSHWTIPPVNKYVYRPALYHGSGFPLPYYKHTGAGISMLVMATTMHARTVRLWKETLCNNGENKALNSNNSFVYGQRHKVWVLVFLVRTSGTFWDQNWADLVKFSVLQQNRIDYSNSMQETLLSISSNGLGNKTVISCLFVV